jgi:nitrogenase molybdenum-cofactor synthesis protein NifE
MTTPDRTDIFSEPACDHNRSKSSKEKKAGCPKPKPGATAGGCAFDGAMITLVPIVDAAHVVHGPIACAGNSWDGRGSLSSGPTLYQRGFTSDLSETDIIFGGEQKLYDTILEAGRRHSPAAVFVYETCVTATIGDDVAAEGDLELVAIGLGPGLADSRDHAPPVGVLARNGRLDER